MTTHVGGSNGISPNTHLSFPKRQHLREAPPTSPQKLTKSRGPAAPGAEPPRAARTARRHGGRTSLPPMLVQSRRPPRRSDAGAEGGFLQLRVSTLGPPKTHAIARRSDSRRFQR